MIVEGLSERLGLMQSRQDSLKIAERASRRAQGELEVDGLLARVTRLWQMWEGTERLLEARHRLAVGRPRQGLLPRLPAVRHSLVPHLPLQGMMGQVVDRLDHPISSAGFEGLDDACVQSAPPLVWEAGIRHLMRERVLK